MFFRWEGRLIHHKEREREKEKERGIQVTFSLEPNKVSLSLSRPSRKSKTVRIVIERKQKKKSDSTLDWTERQIQNAFAGKDARAQQTTTRVGRWRYDQPAAADKSGVIAEKTRRESSFLFFLQEEKKNSFFFFLRLTEDVSLVILVSLGCHGNDSMSFRKKKENQIISAPSVKGVAIFSIASIKGPSKRVNEILDDVCGRAKVFCRYQNANLIDFGLFWQRRGHVNKKRKFDI